VKFKTLLEICCERIIRHVFIKQLSNVLNVFYGCVAMFVMTLQIAALNYADFVYLNHRVHSIICKTKHSKWFPSIFNCNFVVCLED